MSSDFEFTEVELQDQINPNGEILQESTVVEDLNSFESLPEPETDASTEDPQPLSGYELVADMMRRQDEVISQLDELNRKIESAITQISEARKSEEQATQNGTENDDPSRTGEAQPLPNQAQDRIAA